MNEAELLGSVVKYAHMRRWKVAHFASVPIQRGGRVVWMTPAQADGKGFPDLLLVRERVIAAEIKGGSHRPTPEQRDWLTAFRMTGARAFVWTPKAWEDGGIRAELDMRIELRQEPGPLVLPDAEGDPYLWESGT